MASPPARSPQLVQIQMHLFDFYPKEGEEDSVGWLPSSSGSFRTGQTWHWLRSEQDRKIWYKLFWFSQAIPKHNFISWLAILNRLSTRTRQRKWTPAILDTCILCNNNSETNEHLLFKCSYAGRVWQQLSNMLAIPFTDSWSG
ncbi:hypothetical protein SLEP1_g36079 [Rubroshorea leprosula]|uniref:Reverse transcriptase zinc-binding domain-containing protein n=1 Tax=Rubroshorea leprosula TaxID=152421 RepID=A0AAV5KQH0_9ROSI|nr:hypothetical protein SLEP1_g36079 [Rubroshorea leprosula]